MTKILSKLPIKDLSQIERNILILRDMFEAVNKKYKAEIQQDSDMETILNGSEIFRSIYLTTPGASS